MALIFYMLGCIAIGISVQPEWKYYLLTSAGLGLIIFSAHKIEDAVRKIFSRKVK